jgi:hypothetical protein
VDQDKFLQFVKIAQDIHIQQYLGTRLFERIKDDIIAETLVNPYLNLLNNYIKPMVIHWALVEYLPFSSVIIGNKGVYRQTAENGEIVSKEEIDSLTGKQRDLAQYYTRRFIDFMCFNSATFPEYNSNSNDDVYPSKESDYTNWVL